MKIAFVLPWYGRDIGGGAEAECRGLVHALRTFRKDVHVEVLTTCMKEFAADWNENFYPTGRYSDEGVTVSRFPIVPKDRSKFHSLNGYRLMPPVLHDLFLQNGNVRSPLTKDEEKIYLEAMVQSPELMDELSRRHQDFDFFVFIPYMFATAIEGVARVRHKSVLIPCLHQERYAFLSCVRHMFSSAAGVLYHVPSEQRFGQLLYGAMPNREFQIGEKVDISPPRGDGESFRQKRDMKKPYILYAGRKIEGKNLPLLVSYHQAARERLGESFPDLVIIGGGDLDYSQLSQTHGIHDLGFVSLAEKYDAMAGAMALCQPSLNESFSIVMMEAWLQSRPVLAHQHCDVTREHCELSGGGLVFHSASSYANMVTKLATTPQITDEMGKLGRKYVLENFAPDVVVDKFCNALSQLNGV